MRFLDSSAIYKEISGLLVSSDFARIDVAFLRESGLSQVYSDIEAFLKRENTKMELTIGVSNFYITEPTALKRLLLLSKKYTALHAFYMYWEGYHPKLFFFDQKGQASIIIGSSNLTGPALKDNVEANVLIEQAPASLVTQIRTFWSGYEESRLPLSSSFVEDYSIDFEARRKKLESIRKRKPRLTNADKTPPSSFVQARLIFYQR